MRRSWAWALLICASCKSPRATEVHITGGAQHWTDSGYTEMTPAIRYPTNALSRDRITIWLRLPEGRSVDVSRSRSGGKPLVKMPVGASADRVELLRVGQSEPAQWTVADVRGTDFGSDGEHFHTYRPMSADAGAELYGQSWLRDDAEGSEQALHAFTDFLKTRPQPMGDKLDDLQVESFVKNHACAPCHLRDRPQLSRYSPGTPAWATDASGLFGVQAVLVDTAVVPNHRPRDLNADSPYVAVRCGNQPATLLDDGGGARHWRCANESAPLATLDLAAARAAGDGYAEAVCASRRYLFDHMTDGARAAFASAFASCGL